MKKRILCFGDSNTWGFIPGVGDRYDEDTRWTGRLQTILGDDYAVVEEGMNGRTAAFLDFLEPWCIGIEYIAPCLISQFPLDAIVIMLGTNDTKTRYGASAEEVGYGVSELLHKIKYVCQKTGLERPATLIMAPPAIGDMDGDPEFGPDSILKSRILGPILAEKAEAHGCDFVDIAKIVTEVGVDNVHMTPEGHAKVAETVAEWVKKTI